MVNDLAGTRSGSRARRSLAALDAAGLRPASDFAFRYPHELSGGQRQRVVIAGALVMGPDLVVADEPVSMLDVSIRTELLRLMLDLRKERGLTYLFITHDLSLAWVIADRIAVMYLGKIMEIGPAEQVIRDPPTRTPRPSSRSRRRRTRRAAGQRAKRTILVGETPDAAHIPTGCRFHPRCPLRVRPLPGRGAAALRRRAGPAGGVLARRRRPVAAGAGCRDGRTAARDRDRHRRVPTAGALRPPAAAVGGRGGPLMGFDPADVTATEGLAPLRPADVARSSSGLPATTSRPS